MQIFGRTFRRQVHPRSKWLIALITIAVLGYLVYLSILTLNVGYLLWGAFRRLPPSQGQLAGRVMALAVGIVRFSTACVRWRQRLYLEPPMRDLVTTPATPWQLLRLATRIQIISLNNIYSVAFVLFLYPWFSVEWLLLYTDLSWPFANTWMIVWGAAYAIAAAVLLSILIDSLALCANLLAASIGVGGVAPHYTVVNYFWSFVRRPVLYATLLAVGLMVFTLIVTNFPAPVPALTSTPLVHLGQTLLDMLSIPGSVPNVLLRYFPSVCWFDSVVYSIRGPGPNFQYALLCCLAWLGGSVLLTGLCLNRALSVAVRAGWQSVGAVRPADATKAKPRRFDPDAINGPLEGLLIRRIGRMGRATLRLVSRNPQAGAIDIHLRRTLLLCVPALLAAWLTSRIVPAGIEALLNVFERSANPAELRDAGEITVAACIGVFAILKIHVWGMISFRRVTPQNTQSRDIFSQIFQQQGLLQRQQPTRGDNRYPLIEIYAIGFKDAVLLPTYYSMFWLAVVVATSAGEALLMGLPAELIGWAALIGYLLMLQLFFLRSLSYTLVYTSLDYRRSRLLAVFHLAGVATVSALGAFGLIALIGYLWTESFKQDRFAVPVLGTVNILVIVNIVVYSLARWMYVRRRFDCEINNGRRMY